MKEEDWDEHIKEQKKHRIVKPDDNMGLPDAEAYRRAREARRDEGRPPDNAKGEGPERGI